MFEYFIFFLNYSIIFEDYIIFTNNSIISEKIWTQY